MDGRLWETVDSALEIYTTWAAHVKGGPCGGHRIGGRGRRFICIYIGSGNGIHRSYFGLDRGEREADMGVYVKRGVQLLVCKRK